MTGKITRSRSSAIADVDAIGNSSDRREKLAVSTAGNEVCRYKWHSAGALGWPFPVLFFEKIYGSNFIKQHSKTVMI